MNVYPAAGLINYAPSGIPVYVIDPNEVAIAGRPEIKVILSLCEENWNIVTAVKGQADS